MNIYVIRQLFLSSYLLCKDNSPGDPSLQQYYSLVSSSHPFVLKFVMLSDAFDIVAVTHHMDILSVS